MKRIEGNNHINHILLEMKLNVILILAFLILETVPFPNILLKISGHSLAQKNFHSQLGDQ